MHVVSPLFAWSWHTLTTTLLVVVGLWCAFWIYVWIRYFPIVMRLIGQAPMLLPEPTTPLAGGEDCEFRTADGLTLRGTYLRRRREPRLGVILFGHELHGDRWNAGPYVGDLLDAGYDVFTFDVRNHGASDVQPNFKPRPWITKYDVKDFRAAIDYLSARPDADPRGVGILGISRGGGSALCAAAGDERVRCLFTDGAYPARATHLLYFKRYLVIYIPDRWRFITNNLPDWVYGGFLAAGRALFGRLNNYPFVGVERYARGVRQPVLMVHGGRDTMIPADAARALKNSLGGPSKLWVVADAKHNSAVFVEPDAYRRRLLKFFRLHLAPRRRETAHLAVAAQSPSEV